MIIILINRGALRQDGRCSRLVGKVIDVAMAKQFSIVISGRNIVISVIIGIIVIINISGCST